MDTFSALAATIYTSTSCLFVRLMHTSSGFFLALAGPSERMHILRTCGAGSIILPRFRCMVGSFMAMAFATAAGALCAAASLW